MIFHYHVIGDKIIFRYINNSYINPYINMIVENNIFTKHAFSINNQYPSKILDFIKKYDYNIYGNNDEKIGKYYCIEDKTQFYIDCNYINYNFLTPIHVIKISFDDEKIICKFKMLFHTEYLEYFCE